MTGKATTKLEIPQVRLSSTSISALITEAVPTAGKSAPGDNMWTQHAVQKRAGETVAEHSVPLARETARPRGRKPSKNANARKIQIEIDYPVIKAAKLLAIEEATTFAGIVEAALRSYLKM